MFRSIPKLLLATLFVLMILGADAPFPLTDHAGTQADPMLCYNSQTVAVAFDDAYTAVGVRLARVDADILSEAGEVVLSIQSVSGWMVEGTAIKVPLRPQVESIPNGIYQVRCRVWDEYGNVSAWGTTIWVSKQWRNLQPPGGCRTVA